MRSFKVLAPYVTLKVKDLNGEDVIRGFYLDGVVHDPVEDDRFKKHVRTKMVEEIKAPKADKPADPPPPPAEPPAKSADKPTWVAWAVSKGAKQEEAEAATKDDLIAAYGA